MIYDFDGEPILEVGSPYGVASHDMANMWADTFGVTSIPLAATVNLRLDPCKVDADFIDLCQANGIHILNPGLNQKDHTMTRVYYAQWKATYGPLNGLKVGWGGVSGLKGRPDQDRVAAAFEAFGYLDALPLAVELEDCIGDEAPFAYLRRDYLPISNASYAIFGTNILGSGENFAFDCTREMIQFFASQ